MRITVLGATGMAGTAVVNEALSRDHEVTAVSRRRRHRACGGRRPRDHDRIDQALADLPPEPVHVPDIVVVNDSCQLDLDDDHRTIALLEIRPAS